LFFFPAQVLLKGLNADAQDEITNLNLGLTKRILLGFA